MKNLKPGPHCPALKNAPHLAQIARSALITLGQLATIPAPPLPSEELDERLFYARCSGKYKFRACREKKASWIEIK